MTENPASKAATERLQRAAAEGCAESRLLLSRRAMLGVSASFCSWAFMPRFAEAAADDPRFMVVILRGGVDGLNTCVPVGDGRYASMRGDLALPRSSLIPIPAPGFGNFFALHPAMKHFSALYKNGDASIIHATGVPLRSRSHFDAQDNLENGLGPAVQPGSTGWLNRLVGALPAGIPIEMGGAVQVGEAPLIMRGPAPVLGWSATYLPALTDPALGIVRSLYQDSDVALSGALENGLTADKLARALDQNDGNISVLRKNFRGAARLLKANTGPRIAALSLDGFDTHADQGVLGGQMSSLLADLDLAINDFKTVLGAAVWAKTAVVFATEFGRTVRDNGDHGSDHGTGTVTLLAGGAIKGGKVVLANGDWPGLAPAKLYQGLDLMPTTDVRSIFKGLLRDHLGIGPILMSQVFPDSLTVAPMNNLVKTSSPTVTPSPKTAPATRMETGIGMYRRKLGTAI